MPAVKDIYDGYLANVKAIFANKTPMDYATIVNFFLLAFLEAGVSGIVPRRLLDYCLLKIKNYDVERDNFLKSDKMTFNIYKTAKVYGEQFVNIPKELMPLVKKWVKVNPTDYFLFSSNEKPLTSPQVNKMLNKIFSGKHISVDILRHLFVSTKYKDMPKLTEMLNTSQQLGHSLNTSLEYIKH